MDELRKVGWFGSLVGRLVTLIGALGGLIPFYEFIIRELVPSSPSLSELLRNMPVWAWVSLGASVLYWTIGLELHRRYLNRLRLAMRIQCGQGASDERWVTVLIHNKSRQDAEDCEADLIEATRNGSDQNLTATVSLLWSEGHKDVTRGESEWEQRRGKRTIKAGRKMTIDVVRSEREKNIVKFETQDENPLRGPIGSYEAHIEFHGCYGAREFTSNFVIPFIYTGGRELTCDEPRWDEVKTKYV